MNAVSVNGYYTLIMATIVLLFGKFLVDKIKFLRDFNIPEPVAGGLVATVITAIIFYTMGYSFTFEKSLQTGFMLIFFASIGLSADFHRLKQGGVPLVMFLLIVSFFILIQNIVGMGMAKALGLNPLIGLITGSITLTGGHGTGAAWGKTLAEEHGIVGAVEMAMTSATFGLVMGGIIGGPVARRLINKMGRKPQVEAEMVEQHEDDVFEKANQQRLITTNSAIETMALLIACVAFSTFMVSWVDDLVAAGTLSKSAKMPQFVWTLFFGVVLRNVLTGVFKVKIFDRAIDVFGNASLSIFLAIALMSMKLWDLADLAGDMAIILAVQTVVMIVYAYYVTARLMGNDYDAAVLAAGHCGFGLGATPTAVANMQSITKTFGPSYKAFLIVPMVGAFFVDLVNAGILQFLVDYSSKVFG